jgi:hypothetical protein
VASFRMRRHSSSSIVRQTAVRLLVDALRFLSLGFRPRSQLAAENLLLRKQLALYRERRVKPRRADDGDTDHPRPARPAGRLESRADDRETGDADPVASQGIPPLLAVEVECARPTRTPG